jgi:hypothetical protein
MICGLCVHISTASKAYTSNKALKYEIGLVIWDLFRLSGVSHYRKISELQVRKQ